VAAAYVPGAYAEYIKLPAQDGIPLPEHVDYDTAAVIEPPAVLVHGFYRTNIHRGAAVAVMGCGDIGLLAVQWAKMFGAKKVNAIDIEPEELETAKQVGADVLINSKDEPAHDQILAHTNGTGVDLAVESAGSPITSAQVLSLPQKGGEVVYMGIPYADIKIER